VTPIGSGDGRSFISDTSGAGAIGMPKGNDDNSFFTSSYYEAYFQPASNYVGYPADFSMGVSGSLASPVPEPSTLVGAGLGTLTLLGVARLRRRRAA
jgi:hypothetical protein